MGMKDMEPDWPPPKGVYLSAPPASALTQGSVEALFSGSFRDARSRTDSVEKENVPNGEEGEAYD